MTALHQPMKIELEGHCILCNCLQNVVQYFDNSCDTSLRLRGQNSLQVMSFYKTKPCYTLVLDVMPVFSRHLVLSLIKQTLLLMKDKQ